MGSVSKALETVVAADDAAGATLIGMVVYDYLTDQAEQVRPDLERVLGAWALDRVGVAKRHLGRSYVEKAAGGEYPEDDVHTAATWLAGLEAYVVDAISKEEISFEGWARRNVRRDAKGRFARDLAGAGTPDPRARQANAPERLAPNVRPLLTNWDSMEAPAQERLAAHQGQWEQAGQVLAQMSQAFKDRSGIEAVLTVQKPGGQIDEIVFPLDKVKGRQLPEKVGVEWDVSETGLAVSLQAGRDASPETERRIAAFNTLGTVGGTALQRLAEVEPSRWQQLSADLKPVDGDVDGSKLTRFFNQLSAGGRVLSQITGQERLGEWTQFVGSMGPQAEQVLGPYVQRAAYRYRGTEKTPDRELTGMLRSGPMLTTVREVNGKTLSGDSLDMQSRADVTAAFLATKLPRDPILRRLSEAAGNVLPSQGVLFDAEGNVVSQAVGYADDHYLPFDLKGLSQMRGGQYVRTRMMGGPTAEDIYAAVHTGARMLTVVSPSGVYSLEFDPAFRGARAGSDKARQMYDRYIKILDAVKGSGLYLQDIDSMTRNTIINDANRAYPGTDDTSVEMRDTLIQRRINQARLAAMNVDENDIQGLQREARESLGVAPEAAMRPAVARQYEDVLDDLIERKRSESVRQLSLNGEGYAVALQTLQQQFPYFLKPLRFKDYSEFRNELLRPERISAAPGARYATDSGYVGPGGLRAGNVRSGYYDFQGTGMESKSPRSAATAANRTPAPTGGAGSAPEAQTPAPTTQVERAPDAAVPPGGVWDRLRKVAPMLERRRNEEVGALYRSIGSIPLERRPGGMEVTNMALEDIAGTGPNDDPALARWFLSQTASGMQQALSAKSPVLYERLLPVLQNTDVMSSAFTSILATDGDGQDFFESGGTIAGRSNMRDAVGWIADTAARIADYEYMTDPFTSVKSGEDRMFHTGSKPQGFEDLTGISSQQAFDQAVSADPALYEEMARLVVADGRTLSLGTVAQRASRKVSALREAKRVQPALIEGEIDAFGAAGIDEREMRAALFLGEDEDVQDAVQDMNVDDQALLTQRAWSAYQVGRSFDDDFLGAARSGGDASPKDEGPWTPLRPVRKQALTDPLALAKATGIPSLMIPAYLLESSTH